MQRINRDFVDFSTQVNVWREQTFDASAGQTSFTLSTSYPVNRNMIEVHLNGDKQRKDIDYSEFDEKTIKFTEGLRAGDVVNFRWQVPFSEIMISYPDIRIEEAKKVANVMKSQTFDVSGGQTVFKLPTPYEPGTHSIKVFVNGVKQRSGVDFTETDNETITMGEELKGTDRVEIEWLAPSGQFLLGKVDIADAPDESVPQSKIKGLSAKVSELENKSDDNLDKIGILQNSKDSKEINILYPPAPLVAAKADNTDQTSIIQAIVSTGKNIFIPFDTYKIIGTVNITTPGQIIYSFGATINSSASNVNVFNILGAHNAVITGLSFISDFSGRSSAAINILSSNKVIIEKNFFQNYIGGGVIVRGTSKRCKIINNVFDKVSFAPTTTYGDDYGSIALGSGTSLNTVQGNHIFNAQHGGISMGDSHKNNIIGNVIECDKTSDRSMGIYTTGASSENVISDNTIYTAYAEGIVLQSTTSVTAKGNVVTNNRIKNCGFVGISLSGQTGFPIEGFVVSNNSIVSDETGTVQTDHGIYVNGAKSCVINNNNIKGTIGGIRGTGSECSRLTISGNNINGVTGDGITVVGSFNTITGNNVDGSTAKGIRLANATKNVVTGNSVSNNGTYGIHIESTCSKIKIGSNVYDTNTSGDLFDESNTTYYDVEHAPKKLSISGGYATVMGRKVVFADEVSAVTLTNLSDGFNGQTVIIRFKSGNVTINSTGGSNIKITSSTYLPAANETITFTCDGINWYPTRVI